MKKFFKALALVLALTLVIGCVPAAAATTITPKKAKTLYVGGTQGFKTVDGEKVYSKYKAKATFASLLGITKEEAKDLKVTATSSDSSVVKIQPGKMKVKAVGLGDAVVTLSANGQTYKVNFTVKKSATTVIFGRDFKGATDTKELTINTEYEISIPRSSEGEKLDTDERRIIVTDAEGKDVTDSVAKAVEGKDRLWTVKFTKAAEYTITGEAFQSVKSYPGTTATASIKVKIVEPQPTGIKQIASDAFEITFDADIEKLGYYKDLSAWESKQNGVANDVYYKVGGVNVPFSSVKSSTPKENVLTVKMFGAFAGDETYYVDIAGQTLSFKAVGNTAKFVTKLVFTKDTAVVNTNADIEYKLLNDAEVDITSTALADVNGNILFTTDSTTAYIAGTTIYFSTVGDKANVKGVFTFYDPDDNYKATETTATTVITAVAEDATNYVGRDYSFNTASRNGANGGWACWNGITDIKMGDNDSYVNIAAKFKKGTTEYTVVLGNNIPNINKPLQVRVSDEHFAMVTNTMTGAITAVNTGNSNLILYYVNENNAEVVLDVIPFSVVARRAATNVTATVANEYTGTPFLNTTSAVGDQLNIKVSLYDQYGDRIGGEAITFEDRADSALNAGMSTLPAAAATSTSGDVTFAVTGAAFTGTRADEKAISLNVKAGGKTTVVSFRVKDAGTPNADTTDVIFANGTAMDTTLTTSADWGKCTDVTMRINKMNGSYFAGTQSFALTSENITTAKDLADYGFTGNYVARVLYNSNVVAVSGGAIGTKVYWAADGVNTNDLANSIYLDALKNANDTIVFDAFNGNNEKLSVGSYTVMFYKVEDTTANDDACTVTYLGSRGFSVTDNQTVPVKKQLSQTITADTLANVNGAFEFKWNNAVVTANGYNKKGNNAEVYVYYVTINVTNDLYARGTAVSYTLVVPINELLTIK